MLNQHKTTIVIEIDFCSKFVANYALPFLNSEANHNENNCLQITLISSKLTRNIVVLYQVNLFKIEKFSRTH